LGREFIRRILSETDIVISRDTRQMGDWLAGGKYAISIFGPVSRMDLDLMQTQGLPVDWFKPDHLKEGTYITGGSGGVIFDPRADGYDAVANRFCGYEIGSEGEAPAADKYLVTVSLAYNSELPELEETARGAGVPAVDLFDWITITASPASGGAPHCGSSHSSPPSSSALFNPPGMTTLTPQHGEKLRNPLGICCGCARPSRRGHSRKRS